jgi:hypothetical protein
MDWLVYGDFSKEADDTGFLSAFKQRALLELNPFHFLYSFTHDLVADCSP